MAFLNVASNTADGDEDSVTAHGPDINEGGGTYVEDDASVVHSGLFASMSP